VIAWAHGTTGVAETCAPSVLKDPFAISAPPALDQVVANGWVLVATDYIGLGTQGPHAYLVGQPAGRAVLDAVRAARQMPEVDLADKTVVWGHSQGGVAALWSGVLAPSYAPDANVVGVVALSPGSDLPGLIRNLDVVPGGTIFSSYMIQGYSDTYPDVRFDAYVRPTARVLTHELASRCLSEPALVISVLEALLIDKSIWATDPTSGPFGARLRENVPLGPMPAPLLIGQGLADTLVLPTLQAAYVRARCEAGGQVDYRTYAGFGHVDVVGGASPLIPDLLAWTQDRFDGKPASSTC
jgi:alpha-beta hydrolase superfamily lysophospholipase